MKTFIEDRDAQEKLYTKNSTDKKIATRKLEVLLICLIVGNWKQFLLFCRQVTTLLVFCYDGLPSNGNK
jgi:hypothetical protein